MEFLEFIQKILEDMSQKFAKQIARRITNCELLKKLSMNLLKIIANGVSK